MATLASRISDVQAALDTLARQHKVPGAALGILSGGELVEFAAGVANRNTGVPVTTSTLFQIGSNTKVYTATLVMQLVDEGLVELDAPVRRYLPDLDLADAKALGKITVRMLLTHTSGIEGDYFDDFGRGDDGIERYVGSFSALGQIHAPGEMWSYCNSGWTLLGRLVEKLREAPYHRVLRERLLAPLGLRATTVLMEEMLARSCAVGHLVPPGAGDMIVAPQVMMSPSHAPAGSMTASTPAEVLGFVRMHLDAGRAPDGTRVLSSQSTGAMQQPQVKLPRSSLGTEMGLGWILAEWDGERVIGHGGGTIGQTSFLQVLADRRFGVCLLTNSATGAALWRDLGRFVFEELAGIRVPELPKPSEDLPALFLGRYEGLYRRLGLDIELKADNGSLAATVTSTGALADLSPPQQGRARPIDAEVFEVAIGGQVAGLAHFIDFDRGGRPRYVHVGGRVSRRVDDASPSKKPRPKPRTRKAKPKAAARSRTPRRKR
ncbi:MAG: serine hydrolase domain-containing protein [Actinomycetota bacterium]